MILKDGREIWCQSVEKPHSYVCAEKCRKTDEQAAFYLYIVEDIILYVRTYV